MVVMVNISEAGENKKKQAHIKTYQYTTDIKFQQQINFSSSSSSSSL